MFSWNHNKPDIFQLPWIFNVLSTFKKINSCRHIFIVNYLRSPTTAKVKSWKDMMSRKKGGKWELF